MTYLRLSLLFISATSICIAGCTAVTKVHVDDFSQPLFLSQVDSKDAAIVGVVLQFEGKATQPIIVKVKCKDVLIRQIELSGNYSHNARLDAYAVCVQLIFESASFVNSSMTVSYSYTVL